MSSRKATPVTLAPRARQDFIDILRYTGETWGEAQLLIYRDKINDALEVLSGNPRLGHHRDDLPSTHQAYLVGSHVIVYRKGATGVAVVRILHQRMSLGKHVAVAEKLSALKTEDYFAQPAAKGDVSRALRILKRAGVGNPPAPGDELPKGARRRGRARD